MTSIRHGQGYENMTQVIARPAGFLELLITLAKQKFKPMAYVNI